MKYIFSEDFVLCSDNITALDYDAHLYFCYTQPNYEVEFIGKALEEFGVLTINIDESTLFGCLDSWAI